MPVLTALALLLAAVAVWQATAHLCGLRRPAPARSYDWTMTNRQPRTSDRPALGGTR